MTCMAGSAAGAVYPSPLIRRRRCAIVWRCPPPLSAPPVRTTARTPAPSSSRSRTAGRSRCTATRSIRRRTARLCTKVSRYPERTYHPERVLRPLKRDRRQGQRPVRAGELGRGARRHRRAPQGDRRRRPRQRRGDRPLQLRRDDGNGAGREHGGPLLPQARRVAARPHDLLVGRRRGARRDLRRQGRHARRALRREQADRHLGQQLDHLEPALLELRAGGQARRRQAGVHRSAPHRHGREVPRAHRAPARAPTARSRSR